MIGDFLESIVVDKKYGIILCRIVSFSFAAFLIILSFCIYAYYKFMYLITHKNTYSSQFSDYKLDKESLEMLIGSQCIYQININDYSLDLTKVNCWLNANIGKENFKWVYNGGGHWRFLKSKDALRFKLVWC